MNRGAGKKPVFHTDLQRQIFMGLLEEASNRFEIEVHAYCLMGNHFHLLVRTPKPTLSDALKLLSSAYTRKFNRLERSDGPIFRSRFKTLLIDADDYLVEVSRYIHRNPVEAKLTVNAESYVWSSYAAYVHACEKPSWLHTGEVLKRLGGPDRVSAYRRLVENGKTPTLKAFYATNRLPGVLGSKEFKHYVSSLGFATHDRDNRIHTLDEVFAAVLNQTGANLNAVATVKKGQRSSPARQIALLLATQKCGLDTKRLSSEFNMNAKTLSVALSRARKAIQEDVRMASMLDAARRSL
jgi:REP element-mobilizing transposase RayT